MLTLSRSKNDPFIPSDYMDPTDLGKIRGVAVNKIDTRFNFILTNLKAYIRNDLKQTGSRSVNSKLHRYSLAGINSRDSYSVALNETIFDYLFGDTEYDDFVDFFNGLLFASLLSNSLAMLNYSMSYRVTLVQWQPDWWLNTYIDKSNQKGARTVLTSSKYQTTTATTDTDTAKIIKGLSLDDFTNSTAYQSSLKTKQKAAFEDLKSLTVGLSNSVAESLRQAVRDGLSKSDIIDKVSKQIIDSDEKGVGGSRKRARNMVRNRLNNAQRESNRETTKSLNDDVYSDTDMEMQLLWFSALMPNRTRKWHGERHGKIYSVKDVEAFYSDPANAANCYCHQTSILVYKKTGKPVTETELLSDMEKQRNLYIQSR